MINKKEMKKNRILKAALALTLSAGMIFGTVNISTGRNTSIHFGTETVQADDMDDLFENIAQLQGCVNKLMPKEKGFFSTLDELTYSPIKECLGMYSTATTILKMTGLMKDPTSEKLANITNTLQNMTSKMNEMNNTLVSVAGQLDTIETAVKTASRKSETLVMSGKADDFYDNYMKDMKRLLNTYQNYINAGFKSWYQSNDKTEIKIDENEITIDAASVNKAMEGAPYSVNTYRETIIENLKKEIVTLADTGKLTANDSFYAGWKNSTEDEKNAIAASVAEEGFNSLASYISYEQMNQHSDFVSDVYNNFTSYCDKLMSNGSPLEAQIKVLCLTHAFEGEIKDQINTVLDTCTTITGTYATLALSVMRQDEMQSEARLNSAKSCWTNVNNYINTVRNNSITGYDNYCYLTDSLVTLETRDLNYENSIDSTLTDDGAYDKSAYKSDSFVTEDLLINGDRIMGTSETSMLYNMYLQNSSDCGSFYSFLQKEGTGATESSNTRLVTQYNGWCSFDPSDGINMNYGHGATEGGRRYWGDTFSATVNSGNHGDVQNKYFKNCKKATATVFNPSTGESTCNQTIGAMATYEENYWYWAKDEMFIMGQADSCNFTTNTTYGYFKRNYYDVSHYTTTCAVLVLSRVPDKVLSAYANPITAFDQCQVLTDYIDVEPAEHTVDSGTDVNPNPEKNISEEENTVSADEKTTEDSTGAAGADEEMNTEKANTDNASENTNSDGNTKNADNTGLNENQGISENADEMNF